MSTLSSQLIEKEHLTNYSFSKAPIHTSNEQLAYLKWNLRKALILGNNYRSKVYIHIMTEDGQQVSVNTTIWALSDEHIVLKGGMTIPMSSIIGIDF